MLRKHASSYLLPFIISLLWMIMSAFTSIPTQAAVLSNDKASVETSDSSKGTLQIKYTGGKQVKIKVQITNGSGTTYTYDLNNAGNTEVFPLTEGNGTYTVKILENVKDNAYALAYSCSVNVTLEDEFAPFLSPNQYVNYSSSSAVVTQASALVSGQTDDLEKIASIFNYVVDNFTYDNARAAAASSGQISGYLPNVDSVLAEKKGICFDYAAVMASMLRSQNIPCKLVVGYAGTTYHAWINTYITGTGWVDQVIYFDGTTWTLMDPTFVSSGKRSDSIMKYVTNPANYSQKYAY